MLRSCFASNAGLRWQWRKQLSLSLDCAHVFDAVGGIRGNDERLHLSVGARFWELRPAEGRRRDRRVGLAGSPRDRLAGHCPGVDHG